MGGGSAFPNPNGLVTLRDGRCRTHNNITGFKDKRVDEICEQYDVEFDLAKRIALIRELDGILTSQIPIG